MLLKPSKRPSELEAEPEIKATEAGLEADADGVGPHALFIWGCNIFVLHPVCTEFFTLYYQATLMEMVLVPGVDLTESMRL